MSDSAVEMITVAVRAEDVLPYMLEAISDALDGENGMRTIARELFDAACGDGPRPSDDRIAELESILYPR